MPETSPFSANWRGLTWTRWVPLDAPARAVSAIPTGAGIYRVRIVGINERLAYIGQTGRNLRERTRALGLHTHRAQAPFNDPHTAAPGLWVWRVEEGYAYEVSVTSTTGDKADRLGLEDCLLWHHRVALGASTLANYGLFHPDWVRPTNKAKAVALARRATAVPGAMASVSPLTGPSGAPEASDWMGLPWSASSPLTSAGARQASAGPGVYRIVDTSGAVVYVGESGQVSKRLVQHARKSGAGAMSFAWVDLPGQADHQRHEIESDLLGAFYEGQGRPPSHQYGCWP